jgi:nucleoside-diphosphate-sugar epimerase
MLPRMKLVVTGVAGRIGTPLLRALAERDHRIFAVDRRFDPELAALPNVEYHVLDLREATAAYPLLRQAEAVVHFGNHPQLRAAPSEQVFEENNRINLNVFRAATEVGIRRIVYASSIQLLAGTRQFHDAAEHPSSHPELPLTGATPAVPGNLYALSKKVGEDLLQMMVRQTPDLAAVALRLPFTAAGQGGAPRKLRMNLPPEKKRWQRAFVDEGFSWLDVEEVGPLVDAVLGRMRPGYDCVLPASEDIHIELTVPEVLERFFPGVPVREDMTGWHTLVDNREITRRYGWRPAKRSPNPDDPSAGVREDAASTPTAN